MKLQLAADICYSGRSASCIYWFGRLFKTVFPAPMYSHSPGFHCQIDLCSFLSYNFFTISINGGQSSQRQINSMHFSSLPVSHPSPPHPHMSFLFLSVLWDWGWWDIIHPLTLHTPAHPSCLTKLWGRNQDRWIRRLQRILISELFHWESGSPGNNFRDCLWYYHGCATCICIAEWHR